MIGPIRPPAPEPGKVVAELIRCGLGLDEDQVILTNQKFDLPKDDRIYIAIAIYPGRAFGVRNAHEWDDVGEQFYLRQGTNRQEAYSVTMQSRSNQARIRNWEVPLALCNDAAALAMAQYAFKIGYLPTSMTDVSGLDGDASLGRYNLTFRALVRYEKIAPVPYYGQFSIPPLVYTNS